MRRARRLHHAQVLFHEQDGRVLRGPPEYRRELAHDLWRESFGGLVDEQEGPMPLSSARAIESICCWPPDKRAGQLFASILQLGK